MQDKTFKAIHSVISDVYDQINVRNSEKIIGTPFLEISNLTMHMLLRIWNDVYEDYRYK